MVVEKAIADCTDFRIPGLVVIENGTLLRYCECRRSQSDSATARSNLTVKISDDYFKTSHNIYVSDLGGYSDIAVWEDKLFIIFEKTVYTESKAIKPFELFFETISLPK